MANRSVYLTPEFKKAYQSKTGKALTSSVVDDAEYTRLAGEVGGATPTAADKTLLGATRTNSGVSIDGASPLANPAIKGGTLGADRISAVAKPAAGQAETIITQRDSNPNSAVRRPATPGATVTTNADRTLSERTAAPTQRGPAGNPAINQAPAPVAVEAQRDPGSLSFQEWLEAMGLTVPKVPEFAFDPNAAYQAALGEAELAVAPQREALLMQTDRTLRDRQARTAAQQAALRESQARRRLFTSPVGAFLEQENQRIGEQGIRDVEANRDMRLRGLELQKANRALSRVQAMQREAYGNYARAVSTTTQQFNSLVSLYDKTMDNIRAGNKDQATLAKWMAELAIKQQDSETRAYNAETSAYRADAYAQSVANQATKAAGQYLQNWAKIRSSNLVKFGIEAGKLVNDAIEAALAGDDEGANRLMEKAASAKQTKDESEALTKTAHKTFQSAAVKYGPQVAAAIVAGMMETDPQKQQAWFLLAEEGISDKLAEAEGYKMERTQAQIAAANERARLQREFQAEQNRQTRLATAKRSYIAKFGPTAGAAFAQADALEEAGMPDDAAALRFSAAEDAKAWINAGKAKDSDASKSWKGFMSDLKAQESAAVLNADLQKNMAAVVDALVQKWVPGMTEEEAAALEAYLTARGWLK